MYAAVITAAVLLGGAAIFAGIRSFRRVSIDNEIKYQCVYMESSIWPLLDKLYKRSVENTVCLKIERSSKDLEGLHAWYDEATNTIHLSRRGSPTHPPAFWHASELHKAYRHLSGLPPSFHDEPLKDDRLKATLVQIRVLEAAYRCLNELKTGGKHALES